MLARLHHYEELKQHLDFFKDWYGTPWELCLRKEIGIQHGDVTGALPKRRPFKQALLPKLRALRQRIMEFSTP